MKRELSIQHWGITKPTKKGAGPVWFRVGAANKRTSNRHMFMLLSNQRRGFSIDAYGDTRAIGRAMWNLPSPFFCPFGLSVHLYGESGKTKKKAKFIYNGFIRSQVVKCAFFDKERHMFTSAVHRNVVCRMQEVYIILSCVYWSCQSLNGGVTSLLFCNLTLVG